MQRQQAENDIDLFHIELGILTPRNQMDLAQCHLWSTYRSIFITRSQLLHYKSQHPVDT